MEVRIQRYSWAEDEMKPDERGDYVDYSDYEQQANRGDDFEQLLSQVHDSLTDIEDTLHKLVRSID